MMEDDLTTGGAQVIPAGRYMAGTVRAFLGVLVSGLKVSLPKKLYIPA